MPASARHTGQPESYYHGEGRVALTGSEPRFQYKLTDHLGNTMVLFEDINGDGTITTESMNSTDPVEVLQRNFYYAFGLPAGQESSPTTKNARAREVLCSNARFSANFL